MKAASAFAPVGDEIAGTLSESVETSCRNRAMSADWNFKEGHSFAGDVRGGSI